MGDAGQPQPPPKRAAQIAAEIIVKDTSTATGRPGKGSTGPRRRARLRVPSTVRGKVAIALLTGVLVGGLGYCVNGPDAKTDRTDAAESGATAAGGGPNCDCPHLDAGLLTKEYQQQCAQREKQLKQLAADDKLNLKLGPDHRLASGEFCDTVAAGPKAWPVPGGPETPPRAPPGTVCTTVSGLVRGCGE